LGGFPFDSIGDEGAICMERTFEETDVFVVVKALNDDKAPNSFSLAFFHTCFFIFIFL
jgi:hypothetical protein